MGIKRYIADADNTISNEFKNDLLTRATGANAGAADVMEVFSLYGRESTSSVELGRSIVKFPISTINSDRTAGNIPASGSVSFYLRVFNAEHSQTVPDDYKLVVNPVAQEWQEGIGLDMDSWQDDTRGNIGSNWLSASNTTPWTGSGDADTDAGGSYLTGAADPSFIQTFETGLENLELDVTPLVEHWIAGTIDNYGVGIRLSSSYEGSSSINPDGATVSYYIKKFFSRTSQYFFKRPIIEARWNSVRQDNRNNFYYSSSLAPASENLSTLYLYNIVRGRLRDIPAVGTTGSILVSLYSGSSNDTYPSGSELLLAAGGGVAADLDTAATGGWVSTGIYSASICITGTTTPIETLYDVWHSGGIQYSTGTISPIVLSGSAVENTTRYASKITNLKSQYNNSETARFRLYVRQRDWQPTIYVKAINKVPVLTIESASYRVYRLLDGFEAIPYGTGSDLHTMMSYDVSGNYFDLDMSMLEKGYGYGLKYAFYNDATSDWDEQEETFKFRVIEYEY